MDYKIGRILCCVGLRGDCDAVLEQALALALATGAELQVLHAVKTLDDDMMNTLKVNIRNQNILNQLLRKRLDQAREKLVKRLQAFWSQHEAERSRLGERLTEPEVVEGYPASVITRLAAKGGYDMIVMAANKHGFLASHVGRVTKGVLKRSEVPVVVVPAPG